MPGCDRLFKIFLNIQKIFHPYEGILGGVQLHKNKIYISVTLLFGLIYSIHSNWYPERRPFHCLNVVDYFEPSTGIPPNLLATLPDDWIYERIEQIYMTIIYLPIFLYIACFTKLFREFVERRIKTKQLPTIHINSIVKTITVVNSMSKNSSVTYKVNNTLNLRGKSLVEQKEEIVYANLALERSRLFLLCFFSQLPYLLANARYPISRITDIGGNFDLTIAMSKLAQLFGTIFHVQEPFIFLLLSRDMRRGVYKDYTAVKKRLFKV
uniref:Uncharacterized protein n=1 Tax=Meloidogyne enterolobii TaxID=390850 RepID=A0A6V7UUP5_MELEN|nr:unnamed protein product [Meloidogyne enterolobii]